MNIFRLSWLSTLLLLAGLASCKGNTLLTGGATAKAEVRWTDTTTDATGMGAIAGKAVGQLNATTLPLLAAADTELQRVMPNLVAGRDLKNTQVQQDVLAQLKDGCMWQTDLKAQIVTIECTRATQAEAAALANALARALVIYCQDSRKADLQTRKQSAMALVDEQRRKRAALLAKRADLVIVFPSDHSRPSPASLEAIKKQMQAIDDELQTASKDYDLKYTTMQNLINEERQLALSAGIEITSLAPIMKQ